MAKKNKETVLLSHKYLPSYIGETVLRGYVRVKEVRGKFGKEEKTYKIPYFMIGTIDNPITVFLLIKGSVLGQKTKWVAVTYAPIFRLGDTRTIAWDVGLKNYRNFLKKLQGGK